jgi:predicted nucleic acid-binding Zn ribbon protein
MPTYVYKFVDTGETIEVQQSFDEPTLTEAPHPAGGQPRPVKKVFTPVGITFKGNGFYKTDSRGSKNGSSSSSSKSSDSTSSTSGSSGSDSSSSSGENGSRTATKPAATSGASSGSGGSGGHSH